MLAATILASAALLSPQEASSAEQPEPLEAFRALPAEQQRDVMRSLERRILLDPDPAIQAIVSMARGFSSYPVAEPRTFHDPDKWAKGVAPERVVVSAGTDRHDAVRAAIPAVPFLTDLNTAVWYDWRVGEVVRRAEPLSDVEVFENLLQGYPPGSDEAVAHALDTLDNTDDHRKMAAYLGHLYADLKARVYEGITLYEAWYSGEIVDIPDVDAIPFAVQILKTRSYRSPIPNGRRRARLYQRIRDATMEFRKYRTLREAAAAGLVRAEPILDPTYQLLVPRFHYLWAAEGESPERVAAWFGKLPDRAAFLEKMDRTVKTDPQAYESRERRKHELATMAAKLHAIAAAAVSR